MKPFNLEAAKRGEPFYNNVVQPEQLLHFLGECLYGGNRAVAYERPNGSVHRDRSSNLCMAPRKVVKWVNIYRTGYNLRLGECKFDTADEATRSAQACADNREYVNSVRVEWEE